MTLRLATFNVENLFDRAKALNTQLLEEGQSAPDGVLAVQHGRGQEQVLGHGQGRGCLPRSRRWRC